MNKKKKFVIIFLSVISLSVIFGFYFNYKNSIKDETECHGKYGSCGCDLAVNHIEIDKKTKEVRCLPGVTTN